MDKFRKFLALTKVEEQSDGTLKVYGVVTAEVPDRDNEVCDYENTKPYYKARAEQMLKTTSIDGMEQSIMPLREMHQMKAVGKGISMDFDDASKSIRMGFEVVDKDAITKVKKGVLPCFSQGGDYVGAKVPDPIHKGCLRYVADPGEVSLVDLGSLPVAVIDAIKGKSFQLVKEDGSFALVKYHVADSPKPTLSEADAELIAAHLRKTLEEQHLEKDAKTKRVAGKDLPSSAFAFVGDPEDTSTWKLPIHDAAHVRNALARFNQTQGIPSDQKSKVRAKIVAAAKKFGIEVSAEAEKIKRAIEYLDAAVNGKQLGKGLYHVAQMAEVLETIHWLQLSSSWERDAEQDDSTQPEDFGQLLEDAILLFHSMVEEETQELAEHAAAISGKETKAMNEQELKKLSETLLAKAKGAAEHLKTLHAMHKAHHDKMVKAHGDHMAAAHECIGKCFKALGAGDTDLNADSEGPTGTDITASSSGDEGHSAVSTGSAPATKGKYVSIGKTKDGVEIFKFVQPDVNEQILEKLNGLESLIEKKVDEGLTNMVKAMFSTDGAGSPTPQGGVGDRTLLPGGGTLHQGEIGKRLVPAGKDAAGNDVFRVEDVQKGKTSDANAGGPGAPGNGAASSETVTNEDVIKAAQGDQAAMLKVARLAKQMTPEQAERVQRSIGELGLRK